MSPRTEPAFSICVYCGSNPGAKPVYVERATELGKRIANEGLRLVYGGGRTGLMGAVADGEVRAVQQDETEWEKQP